MSVKLYKEGGFNFTPFSDYCPGDLEYLNKNGIELINNVREADIIISQNYKKIKKHFWRGVSGKKFLIWTLESRFDTHFKKIRKVFFKIVNCHIMNVYTRDVFVTNLTIHRGIINKEIALLPNDFKMTSNKVIALMSYYKGVEAPPLIKEGKNIDLIALRSKIAIIGHNLGVLDIFGKGWPNNVSKEDSRDGDWGVRKDKLMSKYYFNLCFENTAAYNYMTEKIWNSIENYCLPIYFGKYTNVYELFPENSFIDYSKFNSPKELFVFVHQMTNDEYIDRMNSCIKVYNKISEKSIDFVKLEREKMLDNIITKVNTIYNSK